VLRQAEALLVRNLDGSVVGYSPHARAQAGAAPA
jgi:hypothetical protein